MVPQDGGYKGSNSHKRARTEESSDRDSSVDRRRGPDDNFILSNQPDPAMQINWQYVLCDLLDLRGGQPDSVILENLRNALEVPRSLSVDQPAEMRYQVIHRVQCSYSSLAMLYPNEPIPRSSGNERIHLSGAEVINDLEAYLAGNLEVAFLVYKHYDCCTDEPMEVEAEQPCVLDSKFVASMMAKESVSIVSKTLKDALNSLCTNSHIQTLLPTFHEFEEEFNGPYLWWYRNKSQFAKAIMELGLEHRRHLELFQEYISDALGEEYRLVDQFLAGGKMKKEYLPYLYVPGEIQLSKVEGDHPQFHQAFKARDELYIRGGTAMSIHGTSWTYNGFFHESIRRWQFDCKFKGGEIFKISELEIFPLRYADPDIRGALESRGAMFWNCRHQKFVCYRSDDGPAADNVYSRYMIDYATFYDMFKRKEEEETSGQALPRQDDLGPEATKSGAKPPSKEFLVCLPSQLPGYHMHKKVWSMLFVSRMSDVRWNEKAFTRLVIDETKKRLIRALVTTHIASDEGTDLIDGKGNGLMILLHGGPGTGKTLTAESVAEIARDPCQRWGCVVLLDEADVFLMQRSVEDYKRNAIVSVFLRVLEYYDGIMILTSNRVGKFDAAFKSRIQLSLHYPRLERRDRLKIWQNFIDHLESMQHSTTARYGIQATEIRKMLPMLAEKELNGREIRNVVSTARHLAVFEEEAFGYTHLEKVIFELESFETYARELKGNLYDDEIARRKQEY
ncbi:P-loop containing nucleoside triphosphate hydrolase [Fusarium oxysporum f. sp. vasinfectum]|nr:P-loop containing nucleoside triphosphate hydrolase [Fusarium oxysporum f. sp. vasinfectum]